VLGITKTNIIRWLLSSVVAGVLFGAVIMSIAWEHNPQGEFQDDLGHWFSLGISAVFWVVIVSFIVPLLVMGIIRTLFRWISK